MLNFVTENTCLAGEIRQAKNMSYRILHLEIIFIVSGFLSIFASMFVGFFVFKSSISSCFPSALILCFLIFIFAIPIIGLLVYIIYCRKSYYDNNEKISKKIQNLLNNFLGSVRNDFVFDDKFIFGEKTKITYIKEDMICHIADLSINSFGEELVFILENFQVGRL